MHAIGAWRRDTPWQLRYNLEMLVFCNSPKTSWPKRKDRTEPAPPFSPKDFLKGVAQKEFSDSAEVHEPVLDRSQLGDHLSTITNRNQEVDFAVFAKHLPEREVYPNLHLKLPYRCGVARWIAKTYR